MLFLGQVREVSQAHGRRVRQILEALDSEGSRLRQEVRRVLGSKKLTTAKWLYPSSSKTHTTTPCSEGLRMLVAPSVTQLRRLR